MADLLSREERREIVRTIVKDFERQHLQAQVERVMNQANPQSDQQALSRRVQLLAEGLARVKTRFADLLADDPEPSIEQQVDEIVEQVASAAGDTE